MSNGTNSFSGKIWGAMAKFCGWGYRLFAPLAFRLYLWRHPGKYGARTAEKFGFVPLRPADRPTLLVHAVSVGEVLAAKTVIDEFKAAHPDWRVVVSTSTATGREVAEKKYGRADVLYYPLDVSAWVERFFTAVRPQMIVLMELEIWPVFLEYARNYHIPVVVANARITAESAAKYAKIRRLPFLRLLLDAAFNTPTRWLAQTEEYAQRLRETGVAPEKITVNGNVKFDQIPTALRTEDGQMMRAELAVSGQLLVGGSTHPGEEETVLTAWKKLREEFPGLKLVLAPRHPHRVPEVKTLAEKTGSVTLRSQMQDTPARADIIIVDTMGELMKFYAAADAVFIGGTLIPHGGQNMAEPCGLAKPTVIGESYFNFTETVDALRAADAMPIIRTAEELTAVLGDWLRNPEKTAALGARARETLQKLMGASRRTVEIIGETYAAQS